MNPVTARYNWTFDDLVTGRKYFNKANKASRLGRLLLCVAGVIIAIVGFTAAPAGNHEKHDFSAVAASIVIGLLLLGVLIGVPIAKLTTRFLVRREFAKHPYPNGEMDWIFAEGCIHICTPISKSEVQWAAFNKVVASPVGFFFIIDAERFHFIPIRAFSSPADIENLKILASQHAADFKECK